MKQLQTQLKAYLAQPLLWIIGGALCCLLSLSYVISAHKSLSHLEQTALILKKRQHLAKQRTTAEQDLVEQLKIADRDYVEKELESLQFLTPEIKKLQALLHSDSSNSLHSKRLEFLQSNKNRLRFSERNFQRLNQYQEVEILQQHPVEMNRSDLKALIARIENKTIGECKPGQSPPDLLIKKFELVKKPMSSNEETFVINLELIKHEMVHE